MRIVHILDRISFGGASRAAIVHARESARTAGHRHSIVSLNDAERPALEFARSSGVEVVDRPDQQELSALMGNADLIHIHFYNTPSIYEFFNRPLPPCRRLLWMHVSGFTPPQVLPLEVASRVDRVVLTSMESQKLPVVAALNRQNRFPNAIIAGADFARLKDIKPRLHHGFNVGYIGIIDPVKMYPRYVELSAAIDLPGVKFVVCGGGAELLRRKIDKTGAAEKFELKGYVADIAPILETLDVFGYPLSKETYSTTDQSLQEAMFAGVPPVVFDHGATSKMVQHNRTGIVVNSEEDYRGAIVFLAQNTAKRLELGENARRYAEQNFGVRRSSERMNEVYRDVIAREKSLMPPLSTESSPLTASEVFIVSLGDYGGDFSASRNGNEAERRAADVKIATQTRLMTSPQSGGILHWVQHFQSDPFLRMWAGLVFAKQGNNARALIEFRAALKLGGDRQRLTDYIRKTAYALNASPAALSAMLKPD